GKQQDGDPYRRLDRECDREVRLQRTAGARVELVERVRSKPDEQRAGDPSRREQADRRYAEQLQHAGRAAPAQMRAKAALRNAPEVVREAERRHRRNGGTAPPPQLAPAPREAL